MKSPECSFYIVRHGETDWNRQKRMQSFTDNPLSEQGIIQANQLAELFKDVEFSAIYFSDLQRSITTAEIIRGKRRIPTYPAPELREKNFGVLEGMLISDVANLNKEFDHLTGDAAFHHKLDESMESDAEAANRFTKFLEHACRSRSGEASLIVTHSSLMRALLLKLKYVKYKTLPHGAIANGSYIKLVGSDGQFKVAETHGINIQR